jgi:adenylate cyclase
MESHGSPGAITVTERAHERLRRSFTLRPRGTVEIKGKGPMACYELVAGLQADVDPAGAPAGPLIA